MSKDIIDVLLVKPQKSSSAIQTYPPIGLGFLSAYLKKKGHTAEILDCNLKKITPQNFCKFVDLNRFRIIGFTLFTLDIQNVKKYLQTIKTGNSNVVTVVGGPQAASDPIWTMEYLQYTDYVVFGEGENSLVGLVDAVKNNSLDKPSVMTTIPNLLWKDKGVYRANPLSFHQDLDDIGAPDWDEINPRNYPAAIHGFFCKKLPTCPIIVTRGCPYKCAFCGGRNITGYNVRSRDPYKVIEEIIILKNKYNIKEFQIIDDNFTAKRGNLLKFCKALIEQKVSMPWSCPNGIRLDTLDSEALDLMSQSGCYEVAVGIESGNQRILDEMKKGLKVETIRQKVRLINEHNINVVGFIMVGYPSETWETIEDSRRMALELPIKRISLTRFAPFPGTPIADELIAQGKISKEKMDYLKISYNTFSYLPENLSERQLRWLYFKFFCMFCFRPRIILYNIRQIHSLRHLLLVVRKIINFVFGT